jgi:hypothetical protein
LELLKQDIEDVLIQKEWTAKESEGGRVGRRPPVPEARELEEQSIKKNGGAGLEGRSSLPKH